MRKAAIVIGHTEVSPGAVSPFGIAPEWEFNYAVATELCVVRGLGDMFVYDTYDKGYTSMVQRNVSKVNQGNYDLLFELHYNSFHNSQANGVEALYHHKDTESWNERDIARRFCDLMEVKLGLKNRGVKHIATAKERGYAALYYPKMDAIMLEPFFGSNKNDCEIMKKGFHTYVDILEELITGQAAVTPKDSCMTFEKALQLVKQGKTIVREDGSPILTQADIYGDDWKIK